MLPSNPNGCFDWWGYTCNLMPFQTSLKYATKAGAQMKAVAEMLSTLSGKQFGNYAEHSAYKWE